MRILLLAPALIVVLVAVIAAMLAGPVPLVVAAAVAAEPHWTPPVAGAPTRLYRLGPDPFARGQHRGVDFAARGVVRAACAGRVVFAGKVGGVGTVSMRCGAWRVSYAPLARVAVREGGRIGAGSRLGRAAAVGIHFGVRREGRRFGYVDPLRFLAARRAPPPVLVPPRAGRPRPGPPRPEPPRAAHPLAAARAASLAPWPAWLGLSLLLTGLVGARRLRLPQRRQERASRRAPSAST